MASRKPSDYVRVECTVLDEDTVRIGGSVFKRISGDDEITHGATICRRCGMKIRETKKRNYNELEHMNEWAIANGYF